MKCAVYARVSTEADGLEVHYYASKPSAFYYSTNMKLDVPKNRPNKAYIKKHA